MSGISNGTNGNQIGTAGLPINPLLGLLANNGGPTKTHALLAGSPAIDRGDPAAVAGVGGVATYDGRGAPFVRIFNGDGAGGAVIDIGAFELQVQPLPSAYFGDYNQNGVGDSADFVLWRKTLGVTSVPSYSGADGDGGGSINPDDYGVWRSHFGQTLPMPGAGNGVESTTASATPVAVVHESTGVSPSLSLHAAELIQSGETQTTSGGQIANQRKSFPPVLAPVSLHFAPHRPTVGGSLAARQAVAASRRDKALVAWLASRPGTKEPFAECAATEKWESEGRRDSDDADMDTVEQVIIQLTSS